MLVYRAEINYKFVIMSQFNLEQRRKQVQDYYKSLNDLRRRTGISEVSEGDIESIELGENLLTSEVLSESTPLLASAGAATGGSIISSIPSTAVAATVGLIGAGAIGGVFSALNKNNNQENHKRPIVTLPDHNYLGPGNSIDSGKEPLDKDDLQAYNHDLDYNKAKTTDEVREADREHILNSVDDILTGDIHSIISGSGIATKYGIESITGVKYPFSGTYFLKWLNLNCLGSMIKRGFLIKGVIGKLCQNHKKLIL